MTTDVLNPVDVEAAIRKVSNRIARGVTICSDRYEAFRKADHAYDVAYATAYLDYDGPAHKAKYVAVLATQAERDARDVADAAYRFAIRQADALEDELRAWQSVNKSVTSAYGAVGVTER